MVRRRTSSPGRTARPCRRPERAFTLVELMVVVAIIGMAMTAVVLNLGALTPETRLTFAGRRIAAMMAKARDEAAVGGFPIGIGYDLDHDNVWLSVPTSALDGEEGGRSQDRRVRLQTERLHEDLEIVGVDVGGGNLHGGGEVVIDFSPLGYTTAHIVHLRSRTTKLEIWLRVNPLTGDVDTTYSGEDPRPDPPSLEDTLSDADFR